MDIQSLLKLDFLLGPLLTNNIGICLAKVFPLCKPTVAYMKHGESEKTTLANEVEGQEVVQNFIEENLEDEKKVEPYKGYKKYGEWVDKWLPYIWVSSIVALPIVAILENRVFGPSSNAIMQPFSVVVLTAMGIPFFLGVGSSILRWFSDTTAEQVAYHELASAFKLYRQNPDNIGPVLKRVSNSIKYFDSHTFKRIDKKRLSDVERYLNKIDDAEEKEFIEEKFHATFPQFMREFSTSIAPASESSFSKMAKDMDSAYTGEPAMRNRLIADLKRGAYFVFTGPELVVTLSFLTLAGTVYYMNVEIGTAVGIFGGMVGLYSIYQNRD